MEGVRSALDRRASDQLKPSPKGRHDGLDLSLLGFNLLVLAAVEGAEGGFLAEEVLVVGDFFVGDDREKEYLPFPVPLPPRTSRNA